LSYCDVALNHISCSLDYSTKIAKPPDIIGYVAQDGQPREPSPDNECEGGSRTQYEILLSLADVVESLLVLEDEGGLLDFLGLGLLGGLSRGEQDTDG